MDNNQIAERKFNEIGEFLVHSINRGYIARNTTVDEVLMILENMGKGYFKLQEEFAEDDTKTKDEKFKKLILDVYKEWESPRRRQWIWGDIGGSMCTNFSGAFYGEHLEANFKDMKSSEIDKNIDTCKPELLVLKSRTTGQEAGIHKDHFDDYIIDEDILIIKYGNKEIVFQM